MKPAHVVVLIVERFVRLTAPTGKFDFVIKLLMFMLIGGGLNHLRHILTHGLPSQKPFLENFTEAAFTALPMCTFALLLIGHLNTLQKRLYLQATRDSLTGLPNRRWFMDNTSKNIEPSQALMIIDMDRFKNINDTFGHDVGDLCLQHMADHLRSILPDIAHVARIGGEEFAIFMSQADHQVLAKLGAAISAGFQFQPDEIAKVPVTSSVGISQSGRRQSRKQALRKADEACYAAKSQGRARALFSDAYHGTCSAQSSVPFETGGVALAGL